MNMPFNVTSPGMSYDTLAFAAFTNVPDPVAPSTTQQDPLSLDRSLQSPLGLDDSPLSELFASPMFGVPSSVGSDSLELDFNFPSLFPPSSSSLSSASLFGGLSTSTSINATFYRPNPPPPSRQSSVTSSTTSPYLSTLPSLPTPSASCVAAPAPPAAKKPKGPHRPTGFRGSSTTLVALDAPIQSRQYSGPSSTAKKRKTAVVDRELAKRSRTSSTPAPTPAPTVVAAPVPAPAAVESTPALNDEDEIPADLLDLAERKRLQNTISARRSRARKQERLGELEQANQVLEEENQRLRERLEKLEAIVGPLGLA